MKQKRVDEGGGELRCMAYSTKQWTAPIYHTGVIFSNHHPSTARDENPGKLLPSAPPFFGPFWSFSVLFGSPAMNWDHAVSWGRGV